MGRIPGHKPISRYRPWSGWPLFSQGFRPFFLLAGLAATVLLPVWIVTYLGWIELATTFDPVSWHIHEMLFGFVAAAVVGFLLTAIPNWTGRLPLQGWPLIGLVLLWLLGRLAVLYSDWLGAVVAALIDLSFLVAVVGVIFREILAGKNWRNLPVVGAVTALLVANALMHAGAIGWISDPEMGWRLGVSVMVTLLSLIGGRIVPSFTRNWLVRQKREALPASASGYDRTVIVLSIAWAFVWTFWPQSDLASIAAIAAGLGHLGRLARWRGSDVLTEPLLLVLHLGYLWVPVGLLSLALSNWTSLLPRSLGLHALTVGAMSLMILAVMTRASLGHTGRTIAAGPITVLSYLAVLAAALTRVAASLWPETWLLWLAAAFWEAGWLAFLMAYWTVLVGRRPKAAGTLRPLGQ